MVDFSALYRKRFLAARFREKWNLIFMKACYAVSWFICFLIFKSAFRFEVKGKENIPKRAGFLLASNHSSFLDPVALGVACPRRLNYMARHDLFFNPVFSWMLFSFGVFPVRRDAAKDIASIKEAMRRVRAGNPLLLFPEGRRSSSQISKDALPAKPGIGFLAAKLKVPVIPAFVKGSERALPKGARFIRPGKIHIHFGKQVQIERGMPYQDIAHLIMENIRHLS